MKRKILLFSLILVMACMSLALLGSDTPDGNLSMDEDDFVELVVDAPLSLHYLESVYSLKAVNQMVGNEGEDGFAEVLYNGNDEAEYVLATAEEGGYAIFHRMTGALMEAGEFGASPYAGQSGKKYYFGPSNYAVKDVNDVTTDIMRGGVMTTDQISAMHQYMAEKRALVVERSETKSYANMLSALQEAEVIKQQGKTRDGSGIVNEGEFAGNPYEVLAPLSSFSHVDNYQIIQSQTANIDYLENLYGSCAFVANVIMLRYFDETVAPGLIPNNLTSIPDIWEQKCLKRKISYRSNGHILQYECKINPDQDNVYERLTKFTMAVSRVVSFGLGGWNIDRYNNYLPACTKISNTCTTVTCSDERFYEVKDKIDNNTPVELFFWTYNADNVVSGAHIVVAYGYCENENGMFYKAHFGYGPSYNSIVIPSFLTDSMINYFEITTNQHSNGNHNCGYSNCFAQIEGHRFNANNTFSTGHWCACGYEELHSGLGLCGQWEDYSDEDGFHDASTCRDELSRAIDSNYHYYTCSHCYYEKTGEIIIGKTTNWIEDFEDLYIFGLNMGGYIKAPHRHGTITSSNLNCMTICPDCGYMIEIPHVGTFTYTAKLNYHIASCTNCSGSYQENHAYAIGISGCVLCGAGASLGGGIIKGM